MFEPSLCFGMLLNVGSGSITLFSLPFGCRVEHFPRVPLFPLLETAILLDCVTISYTTLLQPKP